MTSKRYTTTLNTRPFLYNETKRIAELLYKGVDPKEIKERVEEQNLFQLASKHRATGFNNVIQKRLKALDEALLEFFLTSDTQTSKAILLYALLKVDSLFYEWMREVVWDKFLILDVTLSKSETASFLARKSEQNETVQNWTEPTKRRLIDAYHKTLIDSEMAVATGEELYLQTLIISPEVRNYLIENKEQRIVEVMLGEVIQ